MHLLVFRLVSALAILSSTALAEQINTPAIKDSTILRSTVSCADCPDRDCYKCTLGSASTLRANTGGLAFVRSLVGYQLPVPVDSVTRCTVQFPAFTQLPQNGFNVTVSPAVSSDWDEATVNGNNAPAATDAQTIVPVPALSNMPALDVTDACKSASVDGQFSIYIGVDFGSYEIWSKDSGNPSVLHVIYDN
ncbi:hypothetical protein P175DRAFT_0492934 [Aspergillus ochraceoroseus IBT 24754]|uniref:Carbohydrate-binding module family 96 domain-containing protein n=2 Tax=Aspergillus ochraceoroseus TaxID=138278 RepID=A0A2T5LWC8_9EURO|nr:uncharacterized protein P175DRAFT_0492934 [Aspergillus ochraceoroseus IBT 24754]KKK19265.1 hypothetical protein AOCH_002176 [Aspergillus ochraceoroseus]PTU20589.1 hypothetical protein P175DRAFT_0492934 [Aspergillus ochraceoroseus IBT 24754]